MEYPYVLMVEQGESELVLKEITLNSDYSTILDYQQIPKVNVERPLYVQQLISH